MDLWSSEEATEFKSVVDGRHFPDVILVVNVRIVPMLAARTASGLSISFFFSTISWRQHTRSQDNFPNLLVFFEDGGPGVDKAGHAHHRELHCLQSNDRM